MQGNFIFLKNFAKKRERKIPSPKNFPACADQKQKFNPLTCRWVHSLTNPSSCHIGLSMTQPQALRIAIWTSAPLLKFVDTIMLLYRTPQVLKFYILRNTAFLLYTANPNDQKGLLCLALQSEPCLARI